MPLRTRSAATVRCALEPAEVGEGRGGRGEKGGVGREEARGGRGEWRGRKSTGSTDSCQNGMFSTLTLKLLDWHIRRDQQHRSNGVMTTGAGAAHREGQRGRSRNWH